MALKAQYHQKCGNTGKGGSLFMMYVVLLFTAKPINPLFWHRLVVKYIECYNRNAKTIRENRMSCTAFFKSLAI